MLMGFRSTHLEMTSVALPLSLYGLVIDIGTSLQHRHIDGFQVNFCRNDLCCTSFISFWSIHWYLDCFTDLQVEGFLVKTCKNFHCNPSSISLWSSYLVLILP